MTKDNNLLGTFDLTGLPPAPRGVPQIVVTFDIDANGILNVNAEDKSTGKSNKITITNDKGRLSKQDIERMVADAEKFKAEDDAQRERISARNQLESYVYSVRQAVDEAGQKVPEDDKQRVNNLCDETIKWLDSNTLAEKEEFEHRLQELQRTCSPIMAKIHQHGQGGGAGQPGPGPQGDSQGPTVEEVD